MTDDDLEDMYWILYDYCVENDEEEYLDIYFAAFLCYGRNEVFARHGRKFDSQELQSFFDEMDWYAPIYEPDEFDYEDLSEIEKANVDLMREREEELGGYTPS